MTDCFWCKTEYDPKVYENCPSCSSDVGKPETKKEV
jgi:hypothetical protein